MTDELPPQPGTPSAEQMKGAFGQPLTQTRAWCNLCLAEGREFEVDAHDPLWMQTMETHTRRKHPEHQAALERGEEYVPVQVEEPTTWM